MNCKERLSSDSSRGGDTECFCKELQICPLTILFIFLESIFIILWTSCIHCSFIHPFFYCKSTGSIELPWCPLYTYSIQLRIWRGPSQLEAGKHCLKARSMTVVTTCLSVSLQHLVKLQRLFWSYWKTPERQHSHWSQPEQVHEVLFKKLNFLLWQSNPGSW